MTKPIEISIPNKESGKAQASIPGDEVPRVAKVLRSTRPGLDPDASDEEVVAEAIMQMLRDEVRNFEQSEAMRAAIESAQEREVGF